MLLFVTLVLWQGVDMILASLWIAEQELAS
jgi:hypothetical protein